MKMMRKYRVFVCAVLILCFFSFHISRPRQALAIVPAVSLAAAAVLAVGAAAGLSYTFDNADAESIAGRLQAFLDDVHPGTSIANYFSARGAAVKDGLMYIGRSLYNRIKEFLQWEVSDNNVSTGSTVNVSQTGQNGFYSFDELYYQTSELCSIRQGSNTKYYTNGEGISIPISMNVEDFLLFNVTIKISELCWIKLVGEYSTSSSEYPSLRYYYTTNGGVGWNRTSTTSFSSYFGTDATFALTFMISDSKLYPIVYRTNGQTYSGNDFPQYYGWALVHSTLGLNWPFENIDLGNWENSITRPSSLSLTASDVVSYPDVLDGQSVCVDVGMLTGSTIDEVTDEIIDAAIDGTLSPSISAETWTVDVVTTPQELSQDLDQDLTTDVEDNPTVPDTERIEFDPPAHYTVRDLRTFFPFCIPFDLFDMLGVLAAQPVAPHFEYRFQPGIANIDYTIVIDFQQFDSVALLLRRLEILSFCIGLAMVTRNLIRG